MTPEEMKMLNVGDVVRHVAGEKGYVVTGNFGGRVTAVRSVDITNPDEWDLVAKANHSFVKPDIDNGK